MALKENNIFDTYSMRARLKPSLLVIFPAAATVIALFPGVATAWGILSGLIMWCGGTLLLSHIGRDFGKKKESFLFEIWGGKPSTRMLRHRDATNKTTLKRRHDKLKKLVIGISLPTVQKELSDPKGADDVYDSCVTYLRTATRDAKKFPLVFEENCNYGFRRNFWGMKPIGMTLSVLGTILILVIVITTNNYSSMLVLGFVINVLFLFGWLTWFTPIWVRVPAEAYAERLLEACDKL